MVYEYMFVLVVCNIIVLIRVKMLFMGEFVMYVVNGEEDVGVIEY